MASLQDLPTELLLMVVGHLESGERGSITNLCRVNMILQSVCRSVLYRDVKITTGARFRGFAKTVFSKPEVARIVRSVHIKSVFDFEHQRFQRQGVVPIRKRFDLDLIGALALILKACDVLSSLFVPEGFDSFEIADFVALQTRLGSSHTISSLRRLSTTFDCERSTFAALATIFPELEALELMRNWSPMDDVEDELSDICIRCPTATEELRLCKNVRKLHLQNRFGLNEIAYLVRMCPRIECLDLFTVIDFRTPIFSKNRSGEVNTIALEIFTPIANTLSCLMLSLRTRDPRDCETCNDSWFFGPDPNAQDFLRHFIDVAFETCSNLEILLLDVEEGVWKTTLAILEKERYCGRALQLRWLGLWLKVDDPYCIIEHLEALKDWMGARTIKRDYHHQVFPSLQRMELALSGYWNKADRKIGMELIDTTKELGNKTGIVFGYCESLCVFSRDSWF